MSGNAPSPWSWSDEYRTIDGRSTWSLVAADGYGILSCDGEENSPQGINEPAIASLIASAPMLLALVKRFDEFANADSSFIYPPGSLQELKEAIAAATGETK